MVRLIAKIDLETAGGQNRLSLDFCSLPARGLPPYLPGLARDEAVWTAAMDRVESSARGGDGGPWRDVVEEVVSLSSRLGTREDVIAKLTGRRREGGRGAFLVMTGQQPGALGGPLLALYKAYTAVALASVLEKATRRPFVPLYWCGADDTDFEEIRGVSLVTRSLTPISTAIAQQAHKPGMPAGAIAREWIEQVWRNIRPFAEEFDHGAFVTQTMDEAFSRASDHGEHAAAILVRLAAGALAVVDGRSPAVRRHARSLILDYIREEDEVKRVIAEEGRSLERAGYHAQIVPGEDSGIFLLEDGVRKNVTSEKRSLLLEAARDSVERCSPGVAARNLVQDAVFKPVAVVLGPAEIAYRAQLGALYRRFGIDSPVPVPRLTATLVPPALGEIMGSGDAGAVEAMLRDPGVFVRSMFDRALPAGLRDAAREMDGRVAEAADAYLRAVDALAPAKAASRVKARIADLRNRSSLAAASAAEVGKAIALDRWPFLADLVPLVKPGGKPQERSLSALTPFLFSGAAAAGDLLDVSAGYVDDLLDGRAGHAVYSSTP